MNKYIKEVKEALVKELPEYEIREINVVKRNDIFLFGLSIAKGRNPAPTFYLNEYYNSDISPVNAAKEIVKRFETLPDVDFKNVDVSNPDFSFEKIKNNLSLRLLDITKNREYLKSHPYYDAGNDFGYVAALDFSDECSVVFTKDIINNNNLDFVEIYNTALKNEKDNIVLAELDPLGINEMCHDENNFFINGIKPDKYIGAFVLTNKKSHFGANVFFYPEMAKKIRNVLDEDYYVIPSSIHEVLVLRRSFIGNDPSELKKMLADGNSELCSPEEVLSDRIFCYENGVSLL